MRSHSGVAAGMFEALANEGVNIDMISTSEIKISVVIDLAKGEQAMKAVHAAFWRRSQAEAPPRVRRKERPRTPRTEWRTS